MSAKLYVDDQKSKIVGLKKPKFKRVRRLMRYEKDFWAYHNSNIPKYTYLLSKSGKFLTGYLPRLCSILKKLDIQYSIVKDNRNIKNNPDLEHAKFVLNNMYIGDNKLKLRPYQIDAVIKGVQIPRGIIGLPTGAGKTVIMAALINAWWKDTLVVINSRDLAYQLRDDLSELMGIEVGFIGDGIYKPEQITVGIDKTLVSGSKLESDYMESIEYLVFDEVHHLQSNTWRKCTRMAKNASIRHGFSATPETSDIVNSKGEIDKQNEKLEGYTGPVIFKLPIKTLIEKGWLAKPYIKMVNNELYFDGETLNYKDEYKRIICGDEDRNNKICKILQMSHRHGKQAIGFVRRLVHGEKLRNKLIDEYGIPDDQVEFVHGSSCGRDDMIQRFKEGSLPILLGTVLSEGLNFYCDVGINCEAGKSTIDTKQRLGRILRKEPTGSGDVDTNQDADVLYFDFNDIGHPWFEEHGKRRRSVYNNEGHDVISMSEDYIESNKLEEVISEA